MPLFQSSVFNLFLCLGLEECLFFTSVDIYTVMGEEGRGSGTSRVGRRNHRTAPALLSSRSIEGESFIALFALFCYKNV